MVGSGSGKFDRIRTREKGPDPDLQHWLPVHGWLAVCRIYLLPSVQLPVHGWLAVCCVSLLPSVQLPVRGMWLAGCLLRKFYS